MMRVFGEGRKTAAAANAQSPAINGDSPPAPLPAGEPATYMVRSASSSRPEAVRLINRIRDQIFARIEPTIAVKMTREELMTRIEQMVAEIANEQRVLLNQTEQRASPPRSSTT